MTKTNPLSLFSFKRLIIPLLIGVSVAIYLIAKDFNTPLIVQTEPGIGKYYWIDANKDGAKTISELHFADSSHQGIYNIEKQSNILELIIKNWTWGSTLCLLIALFFAFMRDFMYMYRIRLLSDKQLSWKQSIQLIMLWEFGSAITPTIIGGSALALFIVPQEGIPAGRSTAIVMITTLLDELFYIVFAPLIILIVGINSSFIHNFDFDVFGSTFGVTTVFFLGYGAMCLLTIFILFAIFIYPKTFRRFLYNLSSKRLFHKWSAKMKKMGDDIITSSIEFRGKSFWFWTKAYMSTIFSWTSRFWVVNFLILAFTPVGNHFLVYARQLVMWIILCISPTPGGSGIAEFAFPLFLNEFLPIGTSATLSVLWRIYTYYPYLIIGFIVLPIWSKRVFKKRDSNIN